MLGQGLLIGRLGATKPEISDVKLSPTLVAICVQIANENVCCLKVPVHEPFLVYVCKPFEQLLAEINRLGERDALILVIFVSQKVSAQITMLTIVEDENNILPGVVGHDVCIKQLDNVWVISELL